MISVFIMVVIVKLVMSMFMLVVWMLMIVVFVGSVHVMHNLPLSMSV